MTRLERFVFAQRNSGMTEADFSREVYGGNRTQFGTFKSRLKKNDAAEIRSADLAAIARVGKVRLEWLLSEEGPPTESGEQWPARAEAIRRLDGLLSDDARSRVLAAVPANASSWGVLEWISLATVEARAARRGSGTTGDDEHATDKPLVTRRARSAVKHATEPSPKIDLQDLAKKTDEAKKEKRGRLRREQRPVFRVRAPEPERSHLASGPRAQDRQVTRHATAVVATHASVVVVHEHRRHALDLGPAHHDRSVGHSELVR